MFDNLISKIRTVEEKEKLVEEIKLLNESIYIDKGFGFNSVLKNKIRSWVSDFFFEEFAKENIDKEVYLKELLRIINSLKEVGLRLAFEPSSNAVDRFLGYLRNATGENIILNLSIDPQIIGGVQIIFNGEFRDFSFKKIFEKEFE